MISVQRIEAAKWVTIVAGRNLSAKEKALRTGILRSALIGIAWYLLLHLIFLVGFGLIATDQPNVSPARPGLAHAVNTFDSPFYQEIAEHSYTGTGSIKHLAFYPLYPLILRILSTLTLGHVDMRILAFLFNGGCVAVTAGLLYLIARKLSIKNPYLVVVAWLLWPWAIFMGAMYTEALFCLLVAATVYATMRRQWFLAACFAGLASFTRLPGVVLAILVIFEYSRLVIYPQLSRGEAKTSAGVKDILRLGALSIIATSGLLVWLGYQWVAFGSPFAFQQAYRTLWTYHVFSLNIVGTLWKSTSTAIKGLSNKSVEMELFEVGSWLFALLIGIISIVRKLRVPVGWYVFLFLSLVLIVLNSNTVSINRYILPIIVIFPIIVTLEESMKNRALSRLVLYSYLAACALIQIYMAIRLVNFAWAG